MSGASTRELMGRMGHVSVDAALVYQHRTASRDRVIADALDRMVNGWAATAAGPSTSSGHGDRSGHVGRPLGMTFNVRPNLVAILAWTRGFVLERVTRIELALSAWEADVLPLNYTRGWPWGRSPA